MQKENNKKYHKKENHDTKLSKALSFVLRHGAIQEGLKMDTAGFVKVDDIIQYLKVKKGYKDVHIKEIQAVVDQNDKKRFQLKDQGKNTYIRATQGHSIKSVSTQDLLTLITDPSLYPTVVHGTFVKFWKLIK